HYWGWSGSIPKHPPRRYSPSNEDLSFAVRVGGTATQGLDYLLEIPDTITFGPGETSISFPIIPLEDLIDEVSETIEISLFNDFGCGEVVYETLVLEIRDEAQVEILAGIDTAFVCLDSCVFLNVEGAVDYLWTPSSLVDSPTVSMPLACPDMSGWINVSGTVGACMAEDSVYLQRINPSLSVISDAETLCEGEQVQLNAINNVNGQGLSWSPAATLDDAESENPIGQPTTSTTYVATIDINGCILQDEVSVLVESFEFPALIASDTSLCEASEVTLASAVSPTSNTIYEWTPTDFLDDPTIANPTAFVTNDITYTLNAQSPSGRCMESASLSITVIDIDIEIEQGELDSLCLGEEIDLSVITAPAGDPVQWGPDPSVFSPPTGKQTTLTPPVTGWYSATLSNLVCSRADSIFIRVDELPDVSIEVLPDDSPYCPGDIISLVSPDPPGGQFPGLNFSWLPGPGILSDLDNKNILVELIDDFTYLRVNRFATCEDTSSVFIEVDTEIPSLGTSADTLICLGEEIALQAFTDGMGELNWSPGGSDEELILVSPLTTTNYEVSFEYRCGELMEEVLVTVAPEVMVAINVVPDSQDINNLYEGDMIMLEAAAEGFEPGSLNYSWQINGEEVSMEALLETALALGENTYTVVVTTPDGCEGTASISINGQEPEVQMPNAFTPNGDGNNDRFNLVILGGNVEILEFQIFNRYGK
ncbi:MAG: hypothetical protein AAFP19_26025, partial [Bacteroidota bacterium]